MRKLASATPDTLLNTPYDQLELLALSSLPKSLQQDLSDLTLNYIPSQRTYFQKEQLYLHLYYNQGPNMLDIDKYETHALMHRIAKERDHRTPELVDRLAKYIGKDLAYAYEDAVSTLITVRKSIDSKFEDD